MEIRFDVDDFKQAADNSMEWDAELAAQDRWVWIRDSSGVGEEKDFSNWRYAYWTENLVTMVLMRSWLDENFHPYAVVWDDSFRAYVVLTDYPSTWGEHPSSETVADVMTLMKEKGFGTTVMMAAHMTLGARTDRGTVTEWLQGLTNAEMYRVVLILQRTDYPSTREKHSTTEQWAQAMTLMKEKGFGNTYVTAVHETVLGAPAGRGMVSDWLQGLTAPGIARVIDTLNNIPATKGTR